MSVASVLSTVAPTVIGSLLGSKSAPSAPNTSVYQPTGLYEQDTNVQNLLNSNVNTLTGQNNPFATLNPQFLAAFNQLYNTPGASGFTGAAGDAGNAFTNVGNQSVGTSGAINNALLSGLPGAQQVLNLGLDPQQALHDRMRQQAADTANVTNAQYGLTGQQAASNATQKINDFETDWQNQQLSRALAGLGGFNQTLGTAGTTGTATQNIGSAGAGSILAGGATPYTTGQTIGTNQEAALAAYLQQLLGPVTSSEGTIGDIMGYLGRGINAGAAGQAASLNDYYAQLAGAGGGAQMGSSIGDALSGLFNTQASPASGSNQLPWLMPGYGNSAGASYYGGY